MHFLKKHSQINFKLVFLHLLVWGGLLALPYLFNPPKQSFDLEKLPYHFFAVTSILHAILFYVNAYWLYPRFFHKNARGRYAVAATILIGFIFFLKVMLMQFEIFNISFNVYTFPFLFFPTVLFVLISIVYKMVIDKSNLENERMDVELKFLRSQINPHFLFNVLNNMVAMARKKSDQLEPSLIKLSELMRYMLYESADEKVPLKKEIKYLKSYIELQKIRFSDSVVINADLPEPENNHTIDPMLLIPFVENAFKHGIGLIADSQIDISLKVDNNTLLFRVINRFNNDENIQKDSSSGIGLANVKKRLNILYPRRHKLKTSTAENIFNVNLKLHLK